MRRVLAVTGIALPSVAASQSPAARNSHILVGTPTSGVLLFGGGASGAPRLADTLWSWSGNAWRAAAGDGPQARNLPAAAYDSRRRVLVLYGGTGFGNGTRFGDTWEWDGTAWAQKNVRTPGPRDHHAMAFDAARGKMVMFGGNGSPGTWTWDGNVWELADTTSGPPPLAHHAMAYDERRQRVVLYGGFPATGGARLADTWEWNGQQWSRSATPTSPGPRSHHRLAYDAQRGVTVLFGGGDSTSTDTWTYNGETWERRDTAGPPARWSPALAYDAQRGRVVLFGGGRSARPFGNLGDTWEWTGERWELRRP